LETAALEILAPLSVSAEVGHMGVKYSLELRPTIIKILFRQLGICKFIKDLFLTLFNTPN
jgi:hypothetical protein